MITIIIGAVLGMIIFIWGVWDDRSLYTPAGVFGCIIGLIVGLIVAFCIPIKTEIEKTSYNLESLQDNTSIDGSFFLGCGNINGTMKYVFYYETDGSYKMLQLPYRIVSIKYTELRPHGEQFTTIETDDIINKFSARMCIGNTEHILYIPRGSIKHNYNLDSQ